MGVVEQVEIEPEPLADETEGASEGIACAGDVAWQCDARGNASAPDDCAARGERCVTGVGCRPCEPNEVRCDGEGNIIARRLVRSSGNKEWDEAVLRALDRTGVLPRDVDGRVPSPMLLDFRPRDI